MLSPEIGIGELRLSVLGRHVTFLEGNRTWSCSDEGKLQLKLQFCICVEYGLNIPNVRPNHPMKELEVFVCLKPGISLDFS